MKTVPALSRGDETDLLNAIALVRAQGLDVQAVTGDGRWVKPIEIAADAGLKPACVNKRLYHAECPPFTALRGMRGTINKVRPTPALLLFLSRPADPAQVRGPREVAR